MAEDKNGIIVYADWIDKFEDLSDEEAGQLIKHFFRYVNDLNPTAPDRIIKMAFHDIEKTLKRDLKKWEKSVEEKSKSGIIGNLKRWHLDLYQKFISNQITLEAALSIAESRKVSHTDEVREIKSQTIPNIAVNVNDSVSVNDNVISNNKISSTKIEFDFFWNDYDKKVGDKEKIKRKWDGLKIEDQKLILIHIPKYKNSQLDKKYRKDPQTYLNNKSWLDEIITSQNLNNNGTIIKTGNNSTGREEFGRL